MNWTGTSGRRVGTPGFPVAAFLGTFGKARRIRKPSISGFDRDPVIPYSTFRARAPGYVHSYSLKLSAICFPVLLELRPVGRIFVKVTVRKWPIGIDIAIGTDHVLTPVPLILKNGVFNVVRV